MVTYPTITLNAADGVVIARTAIEPGTAVAAGVATSERIPAGHKVAIRGHAPGEAVLKYGQVIGFATQPIAPGQHIHTHNLAMGDFARDYAFGRDAKPTPFIASPATSQASAARTGGSRRATTSAFSLR